MCDTEEVRGLLVALTPKVQQYTEELKAQVVGNALCGQQSQGDSEEVRGLLTALTPKAQQAIRAARTLRGAGCSSPGENSEKS